MNFPQRLDTRSAFLEMEQAITTLKKSASKNILEDIARGVVKGKLLDGVNFSKLSLGEGPDALLFDSCVIRSANFKSAKISNTIIRDTTISSTSFRGATLSDVVFKNVEFKDVDLSGINPTEVEIWSCKFENVRFPKGQFTDRILFMKSGDRSDIIRCDLSEFGNSYWWSRITECKMPKLKYLLKNSAVYSCSFSGVDFSNIKNKVKNAYFKDCDFRKARFTNAAVNVYAAVKCSFSGVDFSGSNISGNFDFCDFSGSNVSSADLSRMEGLTAPSLIPGSKSFPKGLIYDDLTVFPNGKTYADTIADQNKIDKDLLWNGHLERLLQRHLADAGYKFFYDKGAIGKIGDFQFSITVIDGHVPRNRTPRDVWGVIKGYYESNFGDQLKKNFNMSFDDFWKRHVLTEYGPYSYYDTFWWRILDGGKMFI